MVAHFQNSSPRKTWFLLCRAVSSCQKSISQKIYVCFRLESYEKYRNGISRNDPGPSLFILELDSRNRQSFFDTREK